MRVTFNPNAIKAFIGLALGLFVAFYMGTVIATTEGNPISEVAKMVMVFSFVAAVLAPKPMLYAQVIFAVTLDLFKRLMMFYGDVNLYDIAAVLAIAPVTLAGTFLSVFFKRLFAGRLFTKLEWLVIVVICGMLAYTFVKTFLVLKLVIESARVAVEGGLYSLMLLLVGVLLPTRRDVERFTRFVLTVFLFVALYGIVQWFFGPRRFELDYMTSGLSMTETRLADLRIRPFSTLNSNHAFAISMAFLLILSFAQMAAHRGPAYTRARRFRDALTFLVYAVALWASFGRTAWVMGLFGIAAFMMFQTKTRTILFYGASAVLGITIIVRAEWIERNLDRLSSLFPRNSDIGAMAFEFGTYGDRLLGFQNLLTNPAFWTPFGVREGALARHTSRAMLGDAFSHDMIGNMLLNYGVVGTAFLAALGISLWVFIHRHVLRIRDHAIKMLALGYLSGCFGIVFISFLSGPSMGVYPLNFLFWTGVGGVFLIARLPERAPDEPGQGTTVAETGAAMDLSVWR